MGVDRARLYQGDCLEVLRTLPDASVDAIVTDPPGGIRFMNRTWDHDRGGRDIWVPWLAERLAECLRVAKPGSRLLCWALPRTSHWTGTAIEDAGWKIEDRVSHLFGQGFPKHKSKLKPACEDWWLAIKPAGKAVPLNIDECRIGTETVFSRKDGGFGEMCHDDNWQPPALTKYQPHAGRWPANVCLQHSDGCKRVGTKRVKGARKPVPFPEGNCNPNGIYAPSVRSQVQHADPDGLETVESWECEPNCAVRLLDEQSGVLTTHAGTMRSNSSVAGYNGGCCRKAGSVLSRGDSGGASRFFYCSKASRADRGPDNTHPTVKSTDLMRWLIRLIAKPGDTVLDAFMGSGSTGKAAVLEGMNFVGIEGEAEHVATARRRIDAALASTPLFDPDRSPAPA